MFVSSISITLTLTPLVRCVFNSVRPVIANQTPFIMSRECKTCYRPSNNKHFDCPPRMADGRLFTDYRPRCVKNFVYAPDSTETGYLDSYKYRQHLINNADPILNAMRAEAYNMAVCAPCIVEHDQPGTMLPEKIIQKCDGRSCKVYANDPNGLGIGRAYGGEGFTGDKRKFLSQKAAENDYFTDNANCCATPKDDLAYYPIDPDMVHKHGTGRLTIPYGGFAMAGGDPTIRRMKGGKQGCSYGAIWNK